VLWEVQARKGWIRSFPLVDSPSLADLGKGSARIALFTKRFLSASQVGDIRDQNGRRELTDRERKLAAGVQRALKWYGISAREQTTGDQFIAIWVALESILDSINYPGVFAGNRATVRDSLVQTIDRVDMSSPEADDDLLTLTRDMFKGRLLQDVWPVRKKLEIFARSFGIHLLPTDTKLVSHLSSVRGKILHSGRDDTIITGGQLRELQHLVERLVIASAEGAYKDVEDSERYQLRFGDVGPQGGFAPVSLDGRHASYRWSVFRDPKLGERWEFAIEGKIFDQTNADLSYMREDEGTQSQGEPE